MNFISNVVLQECIAVQLQATLSADGDKYLVVSVKI